jgi:hypothetical protein
VWKVIAQLALGWSLRASGDERDDRWHDLPRRLDSQWSEPWMILPVT